jgi:hypothetical protein
VYRSFPTSLLIATWLLSVTALGQTEDAKPEDSKLAAQRQELMKSRMAAVKVSADEEGFPDHFAAEPIFRYDDAARTYVAAALWKLGETGRPRAIVATELRRQFGGTPRILYEHLSLTPTPFTARGGDVDWAPSQSALEFSPVPDAPPPEDSPQRRLLQLRAIARRFSGYEILAKERCELRLLPQPIDRYTPSSAAAADGALFLLTYGTNPEIALFVESDGKAWSFAAARLGGAGTIELSLDDKSVWKGPRVRHGVNSNYTASHAVADIPGIAPDGSEEPAE